MQTDYGDILLALLVKLFLWKATLLTPPYIKYLKSMCYNLNFKGYIYLSIYIKRVISTPIRKPDEYYFHCYVQNNYDDKVTIIQREKCDKNKLRLFIDFLHNKVLILILSLFIKQFVVWLEGLGTPFNPFLIY